MSRPTHSGPWGKCDARLQVMMPVEVEDELRKRAANAAVTISDVIRACVFSQIYGEDEVRRRIIGHYRAMMESDKGRAD